jgi:hypothetical protein
MCVLGHLGTREGHVGTREGRMLCHWGGKDAVPGGGGWTLILLYSCIAF